MINNSTFKRKALCGGAALQALALLGAGLAGTAILSAPASAQDYTSGAIGGQVNDETGAPVGGATVTITSASQGTTRTATTSSSGTFLVNGLPIGSYNVAVEASGRPTWRTEGVSILASQTAQLKVEIAAAGGTDIVVTASRAVTSFSGTTTGLNVDVADFIETKPLGRDLTSIILLAPGTTAGDAAFGNVASIGGSSVAENAYYLNGLNLTNFDTYIGSAQVPFYFYKSVETKIGGYPAEFGRATGGIVNAVSKSGTNDFMAQAHIDWAPNFLRSRAKNTQTFDGTGYSNNTAREFDRASSLLGTIEAGGPIIRDRLFVYGLVQFTRTSTLTNNPRGGTATLNKNDDPFWGVKVDAYPIDSQHLEFTIFDTRNTRERSDLPFTVLNGEANYGTATAITGFEGGGLNFVGKYTGRFTDFLTLSAAYGRVRDNFNQTTIAGSGNLPVFQNQSGRAEFGVANGGFYNAQRIASVSSPYNTERKFFRADADLRFELLGQHHIRGGFDQEKLTLNRVTVRNGGAFQLANNAISQAAYNAQLGGAGVSYTLVAPDAITGAPIVELNYFNTGGAFGSTNRAYYVQDEWNPFDRLTLLLGVRRDDFRVNKPSGNPIAVLKKNYAPRLGAEYELFGDRSGKVFASYNWLYLPVASNTSFRQGAPSYFFRQRFYANGVSSNGLPILGALVTNQGAYQGACPFALTPNGPTTNCSVTGDGADINTTQAVSANLKATRESELVVGYQQKWKDWTFGLSYTHRNLDRTAEDSAIDAAVNAYCAANNILPTRTRDGARVPCSRIFTGFHQYVINNPGKDITVNLLATGYDINNRTVTLTADELGYGKAVRKYDAVTFDFDKRWNGSYSIGGSYTWAKSRGNSEGYVQSDFGQVDAGITQDFDQPGFIPGAYGPLPNDRRHTFKLFGNVAAGEHFVFGLNTLVQSPRPLSCFGFNPTDAFANVYGAASHYCGGKLSPRGSAQKTDWYQTINISGRYNAEFADRKFTLRFDVFNLLNSKNVASRYEFGDLDISTVDANGVDTGLPTRYIPDPDYGQPTGYQAPRYVRFGLDIAL